MKKILIILAALLTLAGCNPAQNAEPSAASAPVIMEKGEGGMAVYLNKTLGFAIEAPNNFKIKQEVAKIELRLEREDCVIEALKEDITSYEEFNTYNWYSNLFLENDTAHVLEEKADIMASGCAAKLIRWSRDSLGEDDRNHYCVTDICASDAAYTVIIKSVMPLEEQDFDYRAVADSIKAAPISVENYSVSFAEGGGTPMNKETQKAFKKFFLDNEEMHWGVYYYMQPVKGMEKFEALEKKVGKLDVALLYTEILDKYDPELVYGGLVNAWNSGKICELTMQTALDDDNNGVYRILKGEHDGFLYKYAADVARFSHPVIFRPFNEMNGEWCKYSSYHLSRDPDLYIRLYKYLYNIFEECGADNMIWVWNPNETSYPTFKWNSAELYYPGGNYVDAVGLCGYNAGTGIEGEQWREFDEIYDGYYEKMDKTYNKPMMISEFGCSSIGGDKLKWVENMFASFKKYPKIHTAVWLHADETDDSGNITRSFFLDDTEGVSEVFRKNLNQ